MSIKKCVYVPGAVSQELAALKELSLPTIKRFADSIGADFQIIGTKKYPTWPSSYELHQIYDMGAEYDWNICCGPRVLIPPQCADFTSWHPPADVGNWWFTDVRALFYVEEDPLFVKDGRYYGLTDQFLVTSKITHQLWKPLPGNMGDYLSLFKIPYHKEIIRYSLSHNLAYNGYPTRGILRKESPVQLVEGFGNGHERLEDLALRLLKQWGSHPLQVTVPQQQDVQIYLLNIPSGDEIAKALSEKLAAKIAAISKSSETLLNDAKGYDQKAMFIVGVPPAALSNAHEEQSFTALLQMLSSFPGKKALCTALRNSQESGESQKILNSVNRKLIKWSTEFDMGYFDLDIYISTIGTELAYLSNDTLSPTGIAYVAEYFERSCSSWLLNNKT